MRVLSLVALLVPIAAWADDPPLVVDRTPGQVEAAARQIAPKIDVLCGTHLVVHYDTPAMVTFGQDAMSSLEDECLQPLRYLYYACQDAGARRAIEAAHLVRYECRRMVDEVPRLTVDEGNVTLWWQTDVHHARERVAELASALHAPSPADLHMQIGSKPSEVRDPKWEAFVAAAPPPGAKVYDGGPVDRAEDGRLEGERVVRENGVVTQKKIYADGVLTSESHFWPNGKLRAHWNRKWKGEIQLDEHEHVTLLDCQYDDDKDPVLRGWCGYDGERFVKIVESSGARVVVMKNGKPLYEMAHTAAEGEAIARERIVPKLDQMCGMQLDVRYDAASLGTIDVDRSCQELLRYFYYACQEGEMRRQVQAAHLQRYVCRGVPERHGGLTVAHGTISLDIPPHGGGNVDVEIRQLATVLHAGKSPHGYGSDESGMFDPHDAKWAAFLAAPVATTTATDFCIVDGKKIPLPPTGDPLAPPHVRVQCVHGGKVVTEMSAEGTGFRTRLEGRATHFDSYKLGRPDGESWVREKGVLLHDQLVADGRPVWESSYHPNGKLSVHWSYLGISPSRIELDEHERVIRLDCNEGSEQDTVLRALCGWDGPHKVTIFEHDNQRTVIMTNGKARLVE